MEEKRRGGKGESKYGGKEKGREGGKQIWRKREGGKQIWRKREGEGRGNANMEELQYFHTASDQRLEVAKA